MERLGNFKRSRVWYEEETGIHNDFQDSVLSSKEICPSI